MYKKMRELVKNEGYMVTKEFFETLIIKNGLI